MKVKYNLASYYTVNDNIVNNLRYIVLMLIVIIGFSLTLGCRHGPTTVKLGYTPFTSQMVTEGKRVLVVKFTDNRQEKSLGHVNRSPIIGDRDITSWLAEAVSIELSEAGFSVTKLREAPNSSLDAIIIGEVNDVTVSSRWGYYALIKAKVSLSKNGTNIISKDYIVENKNMDMDYPQGGLLNIKGMYKIIERGLAQTLNDALQKMMQKVIPDIIISLN